MKCAFTGKEIPKGKGIMLVKKNGTILAFIDSKAKKNYLLGRNPRKLGWVRKQQKKKAGSN